MNDIQKIDSLFTKLKTHVVTASWTIHDSLAASPEYTNERCWQEDYPQENGMYTNRCLCCNLEFAGNKYRRVCKSCDTMEREALFVFDLEDVSRAFQEFDNELKKEN